jgi:hypothetical protein
MKFIPKFQKSGEVKKLNLNFTPNQYNPELKRAIDAKAEGRNPNTTSEFIIDPKTMKSVRNPNAKMGLEIVSPEFQALTVGVGSLATKAPTVLGKLGQASLHGAAQGGIANVSNLSGSKQNLEGLATDVLGGAVVGGVLRGVGLSAKPMGKYALQKAEPYFIDPIKNRLANRTMSKMRFNSPEEFYTHLKTNYNIPEVNSTVNNWERARRLGHNNLSSNDALKFEDAATNNFISKYKIEGPKTDYYYHGTESGALESISTYGLDNSLGTEMNVGMMGRGAGKTTVAGDIGYAKGFAEFSSNSKNTSPVLFRTKLKSPGLMSDLKMVPAIKSDMLDYSLDNGTTWIKPQSKKQGGILKAQEGGLLERKGSPFTTPKPIQSEFPYNGQSMYKGGYDIERAKIDGLVGKSVGKNGVWLKDKDYPTAWKELMQTTLNLNLNKQVGFPILNTNGRLQYINKNQQGGLLYPKVNQLINRTNQKNIDFVNRLKDSKRKFITNWENPKDIATHKMGWANKDDKAIIFPNVQNIKGKLIDFTRPPYHKWAGYDSAIQNNDTIQTTPEIAQEYTTNYKKFYPQFNK